MKNPMLFLSLLFLLLTSACKQEKNPNEEGPAPGLAIENMDTSVAAADDFFRFVNGGWLDKTEIPDDRGSWGSFNELAKSTSEKVRTVLENSMKGDAYAPGTDQAKAAAFYQAAMDTANLNSLGIEPLKPILNMVDQINDGKQLQAYLIESAPIQEFPFFSFSIFPDLNNSAINAAYLSPGALGLPEREYYLKTDEESKNIQEEYRKHVAKMLTFAGYTPEAAKTAATNIFQLEKKMAEAQMTKEQQRDPQLLNNPRSMDQLAKLAPAVDWKAYFKGIGAGAIDTVFVTDLNYFPAMNKIMQSEKLATIKDYLRWLHVHGAARFMSTDIEQENFRFYGTTLNGIQKLRPRWERVLDIANGSIGEAIGKLFVDAYFPPEAKQTAIEMVDNIKTAFGNRIRQLDWMSDSTKTKALKKLSTFQVKIGFPDKWKDYSDLSVQGPEEGGSYLGNMINVSKWNWKKNLEKIGKPVDKSEWEMAPQEVNAYYNPLNNEIVFPAAILQPPFYNYKADAAVNYGGIGAVIGHEISHGFDDQGSQFDEKGNLKNWWTEEDRSRFETRTQKLVEQYNQYEPLPGVKVNGAFTLGENIGDLGGVNAAYDGLQLYLKKHGSPGKIDGLTPEQRFFVSWATIWRTKDRDEALKNQINTDPHSPGTYRAIGPLVNVDAFYQAFDIKEGSKHYLPDSARVYIW